MLRNYYPPVIFSKCLEKYLMDCYPDCLSCYCLQQTTVSSFGNCLQKQAHHHLSNCHCWFPRETYFSSSMSLPITRWFMSLCLSSPARHQIEEYCPVEYRVYIIFYKINTCSDLDHTGLFSQAIFARHVTWNPSCQSVIHTHWFIICNIGNQYDDYCLVKITKHLL